MTKKDTNHLIIYQAENGSIQFRGDTKAETLWATQKQIAEVFGVNIPAINKHIKNIIKDGELDDSTISKKEIVQKEGKRTITRTVEHYNLDMIISVGYRINSTVATHFRQWATRTLRQHITQGFTINPSRIEQHYEQFLEAVENIKKLSSGSSEIHVDDALELVKAFAGTWFSLRSYDEGGLPQSGFTRQILSIQADELYRDIAVFKRELMDKREASELFAQEKFPKSLEGILGNIFQSAFGQDAYDTIEEKAAHLLYFIIKNHPFTDGNKRTGAYAFIWFLGKAGINFRTIITPATLTALALLIAESRPQDKERMIGLVILLLEKK